MARIESEVVLRRRSSFCTVEIVDYRWDGVHVYRKGAKLVIETIAPALLAIPIDRHQNEVTEG